MTVVYYPKPEVLAKLDGARLAVIEASAGTGKTYSLEHLFVDVLLTRDVRVEEILVVTFTEKATAELRARLRAKIQEILTSNSLIEGTFANGLLPEKAWRIDDDARERLGRALGAFDAASISTIHAFCQRALSENAFASGRLFQETSVDGREAFHRAFREALRDLARPGVAANALRAALAAGMTIDGIAELLYVASAHRGELRLGFNEARAREAFTFFTQLDAAQRASIERELAAVKGMQSKTRATVCENIARISAIARGLNESDIFAAIAALEAIGNGFRDVQEHLLKYLDRVPLAGESSRAASAVRLLTASASLKGAVVHMLLSPVTECLRRRKRETGLFDFDDMLLLVRDGLRGPFGARFIDALRARFKIALIDEFQDTDEVQWEIFRKIFFESPRHRLYLIGDPKQAIYGFRGGDVHTYIEARKAVVESGGVVVQLAENHRSTTAVIEAYNRIFDASAEPSFFTTNDIRYDVPVAPGDPTLVAMGPHDEPLAPAKVLDVGAVAKVGDVWSALGPHIAKEIRGLLAATPAPLRFGGGRKHAEPTRLRARDIFVLTSRASEGYRIADALRREHVPYAFFKQDGLFQTDEAFELATLFACLADPVNRSKRRKVWLSRFYEIAIEDVARCDELPPTHDLSRSLARFHALAEDQAYDALFSSILEETGILRRAIFEGNTRAITNYLHILEILLEEAKRTSASIGEVSRSLDAYALGKSLPEGENGNVQRLESEDDAVQIMTMHKSKGLEATVVFVAGGFTKGRLGGIPRFHEDGKRVLLIGAANDDEKARAERETQQEDQRLLYVALTRAKARLYVSMVGGVGGAEGTETKSKRGVFVPSGAFVPLNSRLRALSRDFAPHFEVESIEAGRAFAEAQNAEPSAERVASWRPQARLFDDVDLRAEHAVLRARHGGFLVTSYTQMKRAADGSAARRTGVERNRHDDRDADTSRNIAVSEGELPAGVATGLFLHDVLESVDLEGLAAAASESEWEASESAKALFEERAARYAIDPRHVPAAMSIVFAAFREPIRLGAGAPVAIASMSRRLRETEFVYPIPEFAHPRLDSVGRKSARDDFEIERGIVKGFIDLLFEHDGRAYVLDWKSDRLASYDVICLSSHVGEHYSLQARIYTLALVKMLRIENEADFEARFGGVVYSFLRGVALNADYASDDNHGIYFARPSFRDVVASERELIFHPAFGSGDPS
jgi:exodeoxyribonuclease V beta subunit